MPQAPRAPAPTMGRVAAARTIVCPRVRVFTVGSGGGGLSVSVGSVVPGVGGEGGTDEEG